MTPHEANEGRSVGHGSGIHRLLPIAGITAAIVAVLAHFGGGAALMHLGGGAVLAYLGVDVARLGGGALVVGLAAVITVKLLLVFVFARTGVVGGTRMLAHKSKAHSGITTGKTIRRAHSYDRHVALLTLGRGRALRDRTIELARIAPGERVLDVGCGTGEITMRAKTRTGPAGSVAGIDPSPEMIAEARRKASQGGLAIDYRVAAVEEMPFPDETFDVVLSSLMMHHLPADLKPRALAEIRRVLKPGGRLVVVDFKQPTSRLGGLAPVWLLHRAAANQSVQELPALLTTAGFAAIETGDAGAGYLGCVRARVGR
ncbi:MAG: class I SAM-dependent methyltransferase [Thermomicrobiales bacterium]